MDPGSPKLQEVFNQYAKDFEAQHAGTTGEHRVRPVGAGARQVHDRDRGRQGARRRRDGHDVDARVRRPGRVRGGPGGRPGRVRLLAGRRRDARRRGLGQAVVRRRPRADLPQGRAQEGRRRAAQDVGRAQGRVAGDQGEGRRDLPDRAQRPDRALLPAGDLAGRRRDRHAGRRHVEGRAELARGRRGDRLLHVLLQGGPDARRPRSAGRSRTPRRRSSTATSRCWSRAAGPTTRSSRPSPSWRRRSARCWRPPARAARTPRSPAAATWWCSRRPRTSTPRTRSSTSCSSRTT